MTHGHHPVPVLMMVHAHPDDESSLTGGTLARYSAASWRTVLVTCTDGGQGDTADGLKPGDPGHDPRLVAAARSRELDLAAAALGVHDVVKLGYPDSGATPGAAAAADDAAFSRRPARPMLIRLVRLIRMYRPDVLVTYPPNGLSGHPDHIRTHDLVQAAHGNVIANAEVQESIPGQPPNDGRGPYLYHIALSRTRLRGVADWARATLGEDTWVPPEAMAVADEDITTAVDVAAFWTHKLRALGAHASQADAAALLRIFDTPAGPNGRVEEYVRVYPPVPTTGSTTVESCFPVPSGDSP
ncbi:PIG-L family deacetylase [Mycobacterium sp. NPDC006124]|uniref:PIG-L deacetylase family protein n=1 Tax=Mycobacterium sp. NPDC006124 TaxID=3156729 RepID=UPI0033B85812